MPDGDVVDVGTSTADELEALAEAELSAARATDDLAARVAHLDRAAIYASLSERRRATADVAAAV